MATPAELARLIDLHLSDLRDPEPNWTIGPSQVAGRGVFAARNIQPGEIIFRERALVVGPTARKASILNTCVCCHKLLAVKDFLCKNKCTLPVCDKCADSPEHHNECQLFRRWQPMDMKQVQNVIRYNNACNGSSSCSNSKSNGHGQVHGKKGNFKIKPSKINGCAATNGHNLNQENHEKSLAVEDKENKIQQQQQEQQQQQQHEQQEIGKEVEKEEEQEEEKEENYPPVNLMSLRLLTAIRVFFLDDDQRALINAMQANNDRGYRQEIIKAAQCFRRFPTTDKLFMDRLFRIVGVCNTNAFETPCKVEDHETLLRGLFPLTAVMNHECTPNASHYFGKTCLVVVRAARFIPKGGEITTTYTKILWSNLARCIFLRMTKNFTCDCVRCNDNTENETYLSALLCREQGCKGIVIPVQTKTMQPDWRCLTCERILPHAKMARYQDFALNTINNRINVSNVSDMINFIDEVCPRFCPPSNYVLVEAKLNVIWRMSKMKADEFTEDELKCRDRYKEEILGLLEKLGAGECTLKKLITEQIQ